MVKALADCSFTPGSSPKRIVRTIAALPLEKELSARQEAFVYGAVHTFRRQLPADLVAEAERLMVRHVIVPSTSKLLPGYCVVCRQTLRKKDLRRGCPGAGEIRGGMIKNA